MFKILLSLLLLISFSVNARMAFKTSHKNVALANVAERLSATSTPIIAQEVVLQNLSAFSIFIGDSTVTTSATSSTAGIEIKTGESFNLNKVVIKNGSADRWDLSEIWGVAGTNAALITIGYPVKSQ